MSKPLLISAAYPFIPAEIGVKHIASTYLPADVYNRLGRALGNSTYFVSGTDVHGRFAENESKKRGVPLEEVVDEYHRKYQALFKKMGISFDRYIRTDEPLLGELTDESLRRFNEAGLIRRVESQAVYCGVCSDEQAKSLVNCRCSCGKTMTLKDHCGDCNQQMGFANITSCKVCDSSDLSVRDTYHWHLELEPERDIVARTIAGFSSKAARKFLTSETSKPIPSWEISRIGRNGRTMPFDPERSLYLWYESLLGKLLCMGESVPEVVENMGGSHIVSFLGKNITYYYGVAWPVILERGLGIKDFSLDISPRGFCQHQDKLFKNMDTLLDQHHLDDVRFYLTYAVKDDDTDFTLEEKEFEHVRQNVIQRGLQKYFKGAQSRLFGETVRLIGPNEELVSSIEQEYAARRPRGAVIRLEEFVRKKTKTLGADSVEELARDYLTARTLLRPVMLSNSSTFEGNAVESISHLRALRETSGVIGA